MRHLNNGGVAELMVWAEAQKKKIVDKIGIVANTLEEKIQPVVDVISDIVLALFQNLLNKIPNNIVGKKLKGMVSNAIVSFINGIAGDLTDALVQFVMDVADQAVDLVFNVFDKGKEAIKA